MKPSVIVGLIVLAAVYCWLVWGIFSAAGFNAYNVLVAVIAGLIIFVPLWKKFIRKK